MRITAAGQVTLHCSGAVAGYLGTSENHKSEGKKLLDWTVCCPALPRSILRFVFLSPTIKLHPFQEPSREVIHIRRRCSFARKLRRQHRFFQHRQYQSIIPLVYGEAPAGQRETQVGGGMAALDYNALRAQTLHSSREEEAVTVNTRALVRHQVSCYPPIPQYRIANA